MMADLDAGTESEGIQKQTSAKPRLQPDLSDYARLRRENDAYVIRPVNWIN